MEKFYISQMTWRICPQHCIFSLTTLHSRSAPLSLEKYSIFHIIGAEFKEFEPRLKFKPWLKYGWLHLKSYSMFHDLSQRSIEPGLRRGSNSLNSDSGLLKTTVTVPLRSSVITRKQWNSSWNWSAIAVSHAQWSC